MIKYIQIGLVFITFVFTIDLKNEDVYDNSWALIVGINDYEHVPGFNYAVEDALAIKNMLINVYGYSLEKIKGGLKKLNEVSLDAVNVAAARIYNPENFILLVMGNQDSCATFLEQFEDVEYYEHTEELR